MDEGYRCATRSSFDNTIAFLRRFRFARYHLTPKLRSDHLIGKQDTLVPGRRNAAAE